MAISKTQAYCLSKDKMLQILAVKTISTILDKKLQCFRAFAMSELKATSQAKLYDQLHLKKEKQRDLETNDIKSEMRLVRELSNRSSAKNL